MKTIFRTSVTICYRDLGGSNFYIFCINCMGKNMFYVGSHFTWFVIFISGASVKHIFARISFFCLDLNFSETLYTCWQKKCLSVVEKCLPNMKICLSKTERAVLNHFHTFFTQKSIQLLMM